MKFYICHTSDFPYFNLFVNYRGRRRKDFYSAETDGLAANPAYMRHLVLFCKFKSDMR